HLEVSSPSAEIKSDVDAFGNHVISLAVPHVERAIDFVAWIVAERETSAQPMVVNPELHAGAVFREPSPLTEPDAALRDAAETLATLPSFGGAGDALLDLARRINRRVFEEMRYTAGVTGVRTPAIEAYALRQGVCQDYAHVMLVLCRLCGLPARYVSGHLLGEGGTHAWVEVLLPDPDNDGQFVARAFDPTHGSEPGMHYVTVATGRDYGDVAPTSGTFVAPHQGELSTSKRTGLTSISYFPEG
ncbi:MAG: transglutaminase family protein, partial [Acidobacteriota bacterium]|nr:transglutaminase family protein [Acidobacteriota bacterium]